MPALRLAVALLVSLLLALVLSTSTVAPAAAEPNGGTPIRSGDWQGAAHFDPVSGRLAYCAASTKMARGTFLGVMITRDFGWSLMLSNDGWHLPEGREYPIQLSFDGSPGRTTTSKVVTATKLEIAMGPDATLMSLFQATRVLEITSGSFDETFQTTGTSALVAELAKCVSQRLAEETTPDVPPITVSSAPSTEALATGTPSQDVGDDVTKDLWCGEALVAAFSNAPADATTDQLAQAKVYIDGGNRLVESATQKYRDAGFTEEQITQLKGAVVAGMTTLITGDGSNAKYSFPDCIALLPKPIAPAVAAGGNPIEVDLEDDGGTFMVPVLVNGAISLKFTVDSGAADVSIPADVFSTLVRTGTIESADLLETRTYTLADGSTTDSQTFRIRSLKVGDTVLENVLGSVSDAKGMLLLGQSFLRNFKSWSIDNSRNVLVLVPKPAMVFAGAGALGKH